MRQIPANKWFYLEVRCALGEESNGRYGVTTYVPGQGWHSRNSLACYSPDFERVTWLGFISNSDSFDAIYVDEFEFFTTAAPPNGNESDREEWEPRKRHSNPRQ